MTGSSLGPQPDVAHQGAQGSGGALIDSEAIRIGNRPMPCTTPYSSGIQRTPARSRIVRMVALAARTSLENRVMPCSLAATASAPSISPPSPWPWTSSASQKLISASAPSGGSRK